MTTLYAILLTALLTGCTVNTDYPYGDDYIYFLLQSEVVECDTDSDCLDKNPQLEAY